MSLPSLGRTQLQPVSPLVKLSPGGTAGQGKCAWRSVYLSISWVSFSPPLSPWWTLVSGVESKLCLPDGMALYVRAVLAAGFPRILGGGWLMICRQGFGALYGILFPD